ncbi:hypothetical protein I6F35_02930 [Bradyrhizobium sp. BRP22]|uniref:hypothetical protein n=1 Tax=Bradyrhizobium sp. BRP22 TaxID=2793821 RepID=UPI001CD35B35|nr:hypothetical protein [Bradyrhizobium sp. BRP22]MCA1452169.1 hypothetical protein [Bradyrhizobium sp. BRP22]
MGTIIRPALEAFAQHHNAFDPEDRAQTVGASDIGQCERKVYYVKNERDHKHGAPRDEDYRDRWGARARGSFFENYFWYPALKEAFGDRLKFSGPEQRTFVSGFLSATPDGVLTGCKPDEIAPGSGSEVTVECKTADPRTNLASPKAENVFQTQVQLGLVRELTEYKPTHSVLSYTDASFWDEGPEFIIPFDPKIFEAAKARAARIMTATSAHDLKPEGWIAGGHECELCPFTKPCGIERRSVPHKEMLGNLDDQFIAEITDHARTAKQIEAERDAADAALREAHQTIKDRLRERNLRRVPGVVTWSAVKGRAGWDNARIRQMLEDLGVDLEEFRTEGEPGDRLTILVSH